MSAVAQDLEQFLVSAQSRIHDELHDFLRIPSVSANSEHTPDVRRAAEWVAAQCTAIGLTTVEVIDTPGHPIVLAKWLGAPGKPTVLIYGHYDVQPPEPLELWTSPAFEPTVRDGKLFARVAASTTRGSCSCT